MKERPILFSAPMVRAVLNGSKTQTRRIVKMKQSDWCKEIKGECWHPNDIAEWRMQEGRWFGLMGWYTLAFTDYPYGQPGDRMWVRETWARDDEDGLMVYRSSRNEDTLNWECQRHESGHPRFNWKSSIHMPRWASRILLEIVNVRVERLQDISEADAIAEGVGGNASITPCYSIERYRAIWESINGAGSWDVNPWVWVIEFKVVTA